MPHLTTTYVHLLDDAQAVSQPVTPEFWPALMANQRPDLDAGRLVMQFDFDRDWPTWEMHPAGEEVVVLLAGEGTLIVRTAAGDEATILATPGAFVVVPRGAWHTAKIPVAASMLFLTPGRGTENREVPPDAARHPGP